MADNIKNIKELTELLSRKTISEVVHQYILEKKPICFNGDEDLVYRLRKELSEYFDVHIKEIEIVGSAKLGISLNPNPIRYGKKFNKDSDIDLVVVSPSLFDVAWHELLKLDFEYHNLDTKEQEYLKSSYNTIHSGYISPDRLPKKSKFSITWWNVFNGLSDKNNYENRKVRGRLFKNWWFVEKYYSIQLAELSKK